MMAAGRSSILVDLRKWPQPRGEARCSLPGAQAPRCLLQGRQALHRHWERCVPLAGDELVPVAGTGWA
ncbi:hypothetical protein EJB05_29963 [Eragrostis curvula]|uniref:Uncharacterized protein n=1 Tax=Eragrostis curvula TaxID=38414 RepID=A0A5J9UVR8_9POAL|nr:hypothetical protein EJB05_29963 [Eragrostis curvula]